VVLHTHNGVGFSVSSAEADREINIVNSPKIIISFFIVLPRNVYGNSIILDQSFTFQAGLSADLVAVQSLK